MNLVQLQTVFQEQLAAFYDADEAAQLLQYAASDVLGYSYSAFVLRKNDELTTENYNKLNAILDALKDGLPIQYALGNAQFYGLNLKVDNSVLIPRPETEELVEWILNTSDEAKTVLDIGTGSGCIAIALKNNFDDAQVTAVDISAASLHTAAENASLNNAAIDFMKEDILNYSSKLASKKFDVIVSNPPYIKEDEKPEMHHNVLANEPHHALFVSNEEPLVFYKAIADFALQNLNPNGKLFFEINEYLGKETVEMLKDKGFNNIVLRKDMQGKDRMILAYVS